MPLSTTEIKSVSASLHGAANDNPCREPFGGELTPVTLHGLFVLISTASQYAPDKVTRTQLHIAAANVADAMNSLRRRHAGALS